MLADITSERWPASGWNHWPTSSEYTAEVTRIMFRRPLDPHQLVFAVGEALAHLNHLLHQGRLNRTTGPEGVFLFSRA